MQLITSDKSFFGQVLESYQSPAILVSKDYEILAFNDLYKERFGEIQLGKQPHCYEVSHGYSAPCDQSGEDCPLTSAMQSGHKERVMHIHQTPRGKEHVDVEMIPIFDSSGKLEFFIELLNEVTSAGVENADQLMVGQSSAFNTMLSKIIRVSDSNASVLLLGESGTGKELAAKAIHLHSQRKDKALVTLECAGLTDTLFESELFGHIKGAFTGANTTKIGLVEAANGGTLFLDEIGDVPLSMQVKLLRLIESKTYRPVGATEPKFTDFRLVCATHKNLFELVKQGLFREDLYYRINVFPIKIPSLSERKEDIPLLIKSLLKKTAPNKEYHFTESAQARLIQHPFYGNIRELRNILERIVVITDTNIIDENIVMECIEIDERSAEKESIAIENLVDDKTQLSLQELEKKYLTHLMQSCNQDKQKVSEIAGISLRSLYRRLRT